MTECGLLGRHPGGDCIAEDIAATARAADLAASAAAAFLARATTAAPTAATEAAAKASAVPVVALVAGVCGAVFLLAVVGIVMVLRKKPEDPAERAKPVRQLSPSRLSPACARWVLWCGLSIGCDSTPLTFCLLYVAQSHNAQRSVVAFENPMYDESGLPLPGEDSPATDALYDEPAVMGQGRLTVDDEVGGYLDVGPTV